MDNEQLTEQIVDRRFYCEVETVSGFEVLDCRGQVEFCIRFDKYLCKKHDCGMHQLRGDSQTHG
jgi:hypothetical protein